MSTVHVTITPIGWVTIIIATLITFLMGWVVGLVQGHDAATEDSEKITFEFEKQQP